MRRAERIVDVAVDAVDEWRNERRIVGCLTRIEAEVLEQLDARRELFEPDAHRIHRELGVRLALRATEVAGGDHRGTALGEPLDGRERRPDPEVVDDHAVVERHVEVGADEDPFAVETSERRLEVLQRRDGGVAHDAQRLTFEPVNIVRSTRRFE